MNLSYYLAKRINGSSSGAFSAAVHRIAVWSTAISLATLILAFGILYGFQGAIKEKVFQLAGHLSVTKYTFSGSFEDTPIIYNDSLLTFLKNQPHVEQIQPFAWKAGLLQSDETIQGVILKGVTKNFDAASFQSQMIDGRFIHFPTAGYGREIALSKRIANQLDVKLGDELVLYFLQQPPRYRKLTVAGIYETGLEEFDDHVIYGDLALIQRINGWGEDQVSGVELRLVDETQITKTESSLYEGLGLKLNATSAYRQYPQIFDWLELLSRNVLLILVVILLLAVFGMISMVLILIMERTHMIGMLKALGASNSVIRRIFMHAGISLIFRGLLLGNLVGLGLCAVQYYFRLLPLDPVNYYINHVPIAFDWVTIVGLNLLLASTIGLTLLVPVMVISGVRPIQAIRFD